MHAAPGQSFVDTDSVRLADRIRHAILATGAACAALDKPASAYSAQSVETHNVIHISGLRDRETTAIP